MKVLDTSFLIDLLRGNNDAVLKIIEKEKELVTTQINLYEVIRGLFLKRVSSSNFHKIMETFEGIRVLSLNDNSIIKSAEISAELIRNGNEIEDCDCLTAGIALGHNVNTIITKNVKHFDRIKGIKVIQY